MAGELHLLKYAEPALTAQVVLHEAAADEVLPGVEGQQVRQGGPPEHV